MRILIIAIHGIMTRQTDPSWLDWFDAWMNARDPEVKVLKKEYAAGPFPRWNCWVRDPRLAQAVVNEITLFLEPPAEDIRVAPSIWFAAHSNGAVIALLAARRLIAAGGTVGGMILSGAACEADLERNGLLGWHAASQLRAAIAYSAEDDAVLAGDPRAASGWWGRMRAWFWGKLIWPYGCLGRTGWFARGCAMRETVLDLRAVAGTGRMTVCAPGDDATGTIFTRWFQGGHSAYFTPENCEKTFEQMYRDIAAQETCPVLAEPAGLEETYDQ